MTVVRLVLFVEPLAVGSGFTLGALTDSLEPIPYGSILYSALMQQGRALVLPQLDMPGLIDSPWEALPSLMSGYW